MYELTRQQAQNIVDRMMKDIPYNINLMDRTGMIIGSGQKARIGTLHPGAVEAIRRREAVEIHEEGELAKKGINLPIELNGTIVGTVGISGEVEETRPFGNLVRSTVILLIEQSIALERENLKQHRKQEFFNALIHPDTVYTQEMTELSASYGIQLSKTSLVVVAEFPREVPEELTKELPTFKITQQSLCIIVQEAPKLEALQQRLLQADPQAVLAVSKWTDTVAEAFTQAKAALRVLKGVYWSERAISYAQCEFIADLSKHLKHDPRAERLSHLLEKNEELIRTLQVYLSCNLNANETAARLMIHRNTLNYRLNRIHDLTGKDPKHILELTELLFMLIHRIH
ncbi:CdaR family transcriptional regulator [Gorillibacterium sp. sgz5001074]|uniref:CdaR family transcriptional regulator n=1 Tax=Gorillibacterium sp. sgz5001074 TaxID=3446695 RepID=UPI003F670468